MLLDFTTDVQWYGLAEAQVEFWGTAEAHWDTGEQMHLALFELKGLGFMWVHWNVGMRHWEPLNGYEKTLKSAVASLELFCPEAHITFHLEHLSPSGRPLLPEHEDDFYAVETQLLTPAELSARRKHEP
jgi:hypothetical protein